MVTETKDVKLMSLKEPRFLSVVKKPANRISFRVVRSEDGEERKEFEALEKRREQKIKIKRNEKLISISFPGTLQDDELETLRSHYGLTEESYTKEDVDGMHVFVRNGDKPASTAMVNMPDGAVAEIEVPITVRSADEGDRYLSVLALRFDKNEYPMQDTVENTLRGYEIDFNSDDISEDTEYFTLTRHDITDDEMIEVNLKEGFTAVVARAAKDDVPASISLGVNSSAYGSYGWGQLNFASAYADIEYSKVLDESLWVLHNVLENILFWSDMSLGDRKVLVKASLDSYGEFVSNLMDALPVQPDTQRSENVQLEDNMPNTAQKETGSESIDKDKTEQETTASTDEGVTRTEETTEATQETTETVTEDTSGNSEFITRTEFQEGLVNIKNDIIEALKPDTEATAEEETEETTETRSEKVSDTVTETESDTDPLVAIAGAITKMGDTMDNLAKRMEQVEKTAKATVIVRTEDDDGTEQRSEEDKNVFSGMFSKRA